MKHIHILIPITCLFLIGCTATKVECSIHEHTFENTYTCDEHVHYKKSTCGCDDIVKDYGEHTFNSSYQCSVCGYVDQTPHTLSIIEQPKNVNVNFPRGCSFSVVVNNESLVKSYQWETVYGYDIDNNPVFGPLEGIYTHSSTLELKSVPSAPNSKEFRCAITDINDYTIYSNTASYTFVDKFVPHIYVGDYVVCPNETLDLSNTPFGNGTISMNEEGNKITFNNVNFDNKECAISPNLNSLCFELESRNNQIQQYELEFVGTNIINNSVWDENHNEGGSGLLCLFYTSSIIPTIKLVGDGSLTIIGGTFSIRGDCPIEIGVDLNMFGAPRRLTKGIVTASVLVKENTLINATLGGHVMFTESYDYGYSNIIFEKGSKLIATVNCGVVANGPTMTNVLSAVDYLNITKADIQINIITDYKNALTYHMINPMNAMYSYYGEVNIIDSSVSIKVTSINDDMADIEDYLPTALNMNGIGGKKVNINNSKVLIDMKSPYFMQLNGIYSGETNIINNSYVDIDISANSGVNGIVGTLNDTVSGKVSINNSKVSIKARMDNPFDKTKEVYAGIRCCALDLKLYGDDYLNIEVNENLYPITVVCVANNPNPVNPSDGYIPQAFNLSGITMSSTVSNELEINTYSYATYNEFGEKVYVVYETIFAKGFYDNPVNNLIFTPTML